MILFFVITFMFRVANSIKSEISICLGFRRDLSFHWAYISRGLFCKTYLLNTIKGNVRFKQFWSSIYVLYIRIYKFFIHILSNSSHYSAFSQLCWNQLTVYSWEMTHRTRQIYSAHTDFGTELELRHFYARTEKIFVRTANRFSWSDCLCR